MAGRHSRAAVEAATTGISRAWGTCETVTLTPGKSVTAEDVAAAAEYLLSRHGHRNAVVVEIRGDQVAFTATSA
jgi:hypothetical protein